ncbi:hypothetical protein [Aliiglaciecola litoralis]
MAINLGSHFAHAQNDSSIQKVRVLNYNPNQPSEQDYFFGLLDKAMSNTVIEYNSYELEHVAISYQQTRIMTFINSGQRLDVMHTMTSRQREHDLTAVKVPLLLGMLGHRVLLIKASRLNEFEQIGEAEALKKYIACQGIDWPDSDILEANGYLVARVTDEDAMIAMLEYERCDYYPRGISEIDNELTLYNHKYGALARVPHIILRYPAPVYFFVAKSNTLLAQRIEKGLQQMQQSGEFFDYISQHKATSSLFPLSQWNDKLFFDLHNPIIGE